ncbi:hypothetical protein [Goodfellowiella coeruleoviolacea]|uniref:hypothetical protein n=1 Tax=Goodfellowiella coeruleoviolacea TaxID=334858 RepID=UPI0020A30E33|nr:hypothetical protein [Goodfellowiella coeruleoviolacea]
MLPRGEAGGGGDVGLGGQRGRVQPVLAAAVVGTYADLGVAVLGRLDEQGAGAEGDLLADGGVARCGTADEVAGVKRRADGQHNGHELTACADRGVVEAHQVAGEAVGVTVEVNGAVPVDAPFVGVPRQGTGTEDNRVHCGASFSLVMVVAEGRA